MARRVEFDSKQIRDDGPCSMLWRAAELGSSASSEIIMAVIWREGKSFDQWRNVVENKQMIKQTAVIGSCALIVAGQTLVGARVGFIFGEQVAQLLLISAQYCLLLCAFPASRTHVGSESAHIYLPLFRLMKSDDDNSLCWPLDLHPM